MEEKNQKAIEVIAIIIVIIAIILDILIWFTDWFKPWLRDKPLIINFSFLLSILSIPIILYFLLKKVKK